MLLLTTTGRRTGKPHTVPLLYLRDGDQVVVIASWGGRDNDPEWYKNLVVEPTVHVQIEGERQAMQAATAGAERRSALWSRVLEAYDGYGIYQSRTDRVIPVVLLTPTE
jgi:deazaflavin-dependent oxidoreductase (nitroreductase family)